MTGSETHIIAKISIIMPILIIIMPYYIIKGVYNYHIASEGCVPDL